MNDSQKPRRTPIKSGLTIAVFAGGLLAGLAIYHIIRPAAKPSDQLAAPASTQTQEEVWTCSMHPQIRQPKPGKCPICFMGLIPVESAASDQGERQVEYSEETLKLMEVETSPVERKAIEVPLHLFGKVNYDQTRVKTIAARVPGRIDQLEVNFTGITIKQGEPMAKLYSPELLSAQTELLQAVRSLPQNGAGDDLINRTLFSTAQAAREKLRLLGFSNEQIQAIEKSGTPSDHMIINAPIGGIVIAKEVNEGDYLETGQALFTIADLSRVWVLLEAYEADLPHLKLGQDVEFTSASYTGDVFRGKVSFIDPFINPDSRTVTLRVDADNSNGRLKPEMFVSGTVHYTADIAGGVPLVIPTSAALVTGKRAVVYVKLTGSEKPTFEGRLVVLGPRAGDYYIVESGLTEGEQVVTKGAFKIDADLQIQAKPSMMNPQGESQPMHQHGTEPMAAVEQVDESQEQTICPVMGGQIDRSIFTIYKGKKVYFCCEGCKPEFEKDPEKYIFKLPQFKK